MTYEHDRALMEGARNSACDDYFSARPQIDTIDRRRVYEAGFQAGAASRDAEIAELVAALEDNWNCNPCETTRQQKAFDVAQSVLVKVRNP